MCRISAMRAHVSQLLQINTEQTPGTFLFDMHKRCVGILWSVSICKKWKYNAEIKIENKSHP